ncbi:endoplasmic reticulum transmembrane protein YET-like [Nylanderia fulva]|uniref:endoplasmic reticulum transmembrane protein YET-like n=1 Tax=Nylanderia fulva TaxID=613905 RepID=UPI0010FB47EF|nr:endoplasmic reticulum transmembrane protein YET-like [Nylanderia fulva]
MDNVINILDLKECYSIDWLCNEYLLEVLRERAILDKKFFLILGVPKNLRIDDILKESLNVKIFKEYKEIVKEIGVIEKNEYMAERNLYLTGFTLFLALAFYSLNSLIVKLYQEEENAKILKKQALNQKDHFESVLRSSKEKDTTINELNLKIEELNKEIESSTILLKQVKNNEKEYIALLRKYNTLKEETRNENKKTK